MIFWRRGRESNPSKRLCRPLHNLFATSPEDLRFPQHSARGKKRKPGFPFEFWSGRRVSNSRPQPWQGCALPTELLPQFARQGLSQKRANFPRITYDTYSEKLEREKSLELSTSTLARLRSTN